MARSARLPKRSSGDLDIFHRQTPCTVAAQKHRQRGDFRGLDDPALRVPGGNLGQSLVNAAGTTAEQSVCGHSDALWQKIIDTNLTGAFRMMRAILPGMIERKWGRIINIGSTAASVGWKDNPAYCASKAGLLGLTRCVALEGAAHGVTSVMISPTWVETELMRRNVAQVVAREGKGRTLEDAMAEIARQNPQQRIIQPSEIAALAVFLCGDSAKGLTMENIQVTGGALW